VQDYLSGDEFFADLRRFRRRVSIVPLRWYGSLFQRLRFSGETAELQTSDAARHFVRLYLERRLLAARTAIYQRKRAGG